jgi:hypothetical protein
MTRPCIDQAKVTFVVPHVPIIDAELLYVFQSIVIRAALEGSSG